MTADAAENAMARHERFMTNDPVPVQGPPAFQLLAKPSGSACNIDCTEQPGRKRLLYTQSGHLVTNRSVGGEQYGRFLVDIFEEWVRHDVGRVFVQMFDVTLEAGFGRHLLGIHAPTCDHFVEPCYLLGNIHETHLLKLVASDAQRHHPAAPEEMTRDCRAVTA